jgi:pyruvate dehydrogenase E2 component (dihydrolipoamide acetyltransferase)
MATEMILPVLGMAQDTGKIVHWLKAQGEPVKKGEPVVEVETDKATVELEAPADGVLANVTVTEGDEVPVGQVIATILAPGEAFAPSATPISTTTRAQVETPAVEPVTPTAASASKPGVPASPLASRIAAEHNVDLQAITPTGRRIQKADVLAYLQNQEKTGPVPDAARLLAASPKARRLAAEQGKDLAAIAGTGPGGAVLAADVLTAPIQTGNGQAVATPTGEKVVSAIGAPTGEAISTVWRIMAERTTQSWTSVPHIFLIREVNASRLIAWREQLLKRPSASEKDYLAAHLSEASSDRSVGGLSTKVTYTDLLVKVVAAALHAHPRINATWNAGTILLNNEVNVGLAAATDDGLVVPVIHQADTLSVSEIAKRRKELVTRAQAGKLRPQDIQGGTFTISNLGMYGIDAFTAIVNAPQAAILAVSRMADRVVAVGGQAVVQPMIVLSLSCDHRVIDGARGAQFLATLAELIEEPLGLLG